MKFCARYLLKIQLEEEKILILFEKWADVENRINMLKLKRKNTIFYEY